MNNGQINHAVITAKTGTSVNSPTFNLEIVDESKDVRLGGFDKSLAYHHYAIPPFKCIPTNLPTEEINELVEQVLDMDIEEQNLLLSLLHRKITDQREAKIRELAQEQKQYESALNFFNKFK